MSPHPAVVLLAAPRSDPQVGQPWGPGGPACVYDGPGLECEVAPFMVAPACPHCGQSLLIALDRLLHAPTVRSLGREPWVMALIAAFGLDLRGAPPFDAVRDPLALPAHLLVQTCGLCSAQVVSVWGYGEYQPGRQVATFLGVAPCRLQTAVRPG